MIVLSACEDVMAMLQVLNEPDASGRLFGACRRVSHKDRILGAIGGVEIGYV